MKKKNLVKQCIGSKRNFKYKEEIEVQKRKKVQKKYILSIDHLLFLYLHVSVMMQRNGWKMYPSALISKVLQMHCFFKDSVFWG